MSPWLSPTVHTSSTAPASWHEAKAVLTMWEIPGPFISSLWLQPALSTAWHSEGRVAQGCRGWVPTVMLSNSHL